MDKSPSLSPYKSELTLGFSNSEKTQAFAREGKRMSSETSLEVPQEELFYSPTEVLPSQALSPSSATFYSPVTSDEINAEGQVEEITVPSITTSRDLTPLSVENLRLGPVSTVSVVPTELSITALREEANRNIDSVEGWTEDYQVVTTSALRPDQETALQHLIGPFKMVEGVLSVLEGTPRLVQEGVVLVWYSLVKRENGLLAWTFRVKYLQGGILERPQVAPLTLPISTPVFSYGIRSSNQEEGVVILEAVLSRDYGYPIMGTTRIPRNGSVILEPLLRIPPQPYDIVPMPLPSETYTLALQLEEVSDGFRVVPLREAPEDVNLAFAQGLDFVMSRHLSPDLRPDVASDPLVWAALGEYDRFPTLHSELHMRNGFPFLAPMSPSLRSISPRVTEVLPGKSRRKLV